MQREHEQSGRFAAIVAAWRRLTEPSREIADPAARRTARLLSSLLLVIAPIGLASAVSQFATSQELDLPLVLIVIAVIAILATYAVSRTRHFRAAAMVTVAIPTAGSLGVLAADAADVGWFAFMALSPALGSVLLSLRRAQIMAALNIAAVCIAVAVVDGIPSDVRTVAITFNLIMTGVLLTAMRHRKQLEADRRRDLVARQRINQSVLEATFGGIATCADGRILTANHRLGVMFGVPATELVGRRVHDLFEVSSHERLEHAIAERSGELLEFTARRDSGDTFHAEVLVTQPMAGDASVLAMRDITERTQAMATLLRAQRMESVGRTAAGIAHDTNNQLLVIGANAETLIREAAENGRSAEPARIIRSAADQIGALVRRVLVSSRGGDPQPKEVDTASFVADLTPMFQQVLGGGVDLHVSHGALGRAHVDPTDLEQVLLNLVLNARDAMQGLGELRIDVADTTFDQLTRVGRVELPPGDYQEITVSDTGRGIAPEDLERIWEPFFTTKVDDTGTGLGLYTSREMMVRAGGSIGVESGPEGTRFTLVLPAVAQAATSDVSPAEHAAHAEPEAAQTRVLIVDDADLVREAVADSLRAQDYDVIEAASGAAALELLTAGEPGVDAVLTDLTMPGMSGKELVAIVSERWPGVTCLVMSGQFGGPEEEGVEVALRKPFTHEELTTLLEDRRRSASSPG